MKFVAVVVNLCACLLVLGACGGSSVPEVTTESPETVSSPSGVVTRFDVVSRLRPLTSAVVAYTDGEYVSGDSSPYDESVLVAVRRNLEAVQSEEREWLSFTSGIDYEVSAIPGLEAAIVEFNGSLDAWKKGQETGLRTWQSCVSQHDDEFLISACMIDGYNLTDEKPLLDRYIESIKQMFVVLGVPSE